MKSVNFFLGKKRKKYYRIFEDGSIERKNTTLRKKEKTIEWEKCPTFFGKTDKYGGGYYVVSFGGFVKRVHVLVAECFLPPKPSPTHQINHIDGNRQNNNAINLEWVTPKENIANAKKRGIIFGRGLNGKLDDVHILTAVTLINSGSRNKDIASYLRIDASIISKLKNKRDRVFASFHSLVANR